MSDSVSRGLAAVSAVGFLLALAAMAVGEFLIAGLCFLSVSLLIYFRETRFEGR